MISSKYKYLLGQIKNRRLLLVVWDVVNNNMTSATIEVAKKLQWVYTQHEIDTPDLVKAVAAWNPEILGNDWLYIKRDGTQGTGINEPELNFLASDMVIEIIAYKFAARQRRIR